MDAIALGEWRSAGHRYSVAIQWRRTGYPGESIQSAMGTLGDQLTTPDEHSSDEHAPQGSLTR
jgi:hypothetical protein